MNIKLTIRLQNRVLKTLDDSKFIIFDKKQSYYVQNLLLLPLYALPVDITDVFLEDPSPYLQPLYKILLEGSIEADTQLGFSGYINMRFGVSPQIQFLIKRNYVIAYATYRFAEVFYRDYLKAVKKSKFLADVKVSLDIERDPDFINQLKADAQQKMKEIKQVMDSPSNIQGFIKGAANSSNKTSARLWFPSLGNNFPDSSMATAKSMFRGSPHKIGHQSENGYWYGHWYSNWYNYQFSSCLNNFS